MHDRGWTCLNSVLSEIMELAPGTIIGFLGQGRLRQTEAALRQLIEENRTRYPRGAANLERFLDGDGGTELYDPDELLGFSPVQEAESKNEFRFQDWMLGKQDVEDPTHEVHSKLNALGDGDSLDDGTNWIATGAFGLSEEERDLHLAIGGFNLHSRGKFQFTRNGGVIHVRGTIFHSRSDVYDWKRGDRTFIPSTAMPIIEHDDMLALRDFGDAEFFTSHSAWQKDVTGTLTLTNGVVTDADLDMVDNGWRPQDTGAF